MNWRFLRRAVALVLVLGAAVFRYWMIRLRGPLSLERRAHWLHETCSRVLKSMGIGVDVEGEIPRNGLVVSNHLSYLDIVILSAAMPCFFVAKTEVGAWFYFGEAARAGGTLFIDRSRRASAEKVAAEIGERLKLQVPVLFFPEGTSTDGTMLKFHTSLFEPAIRDRAPVTACGIRYVLDDGRAERELCWYGDEALAPHLVRTLKAAGFRAKLQFGEARVYAHRRSTAAETSAEIAAMRAGCFSEANSVQHV
ncbi:lysophospholipid acyltransferase family protein [Occallatibacter savannae]|uniref:lysophospholipid acyltransferase family protein n=1 Tax=Occallatibacter savannae TaxID=1002691 RepID=UPI0013A58347|nr:lysophospholipid acyltransferase family protein [Occallatibacter savannae]